MAYTVEISKHVMHAWTLLIENKKKIGLTRSEFNVAEEKFIKLVLNESFGVTIELEPDTHNNKRYACKYLGVAAVVVKVEEYQELIIEELDYPKST
ncbi:hypothetical protein Q4524_19435 [Alteromonas stellipolaris]|uniref:hypothetical protein n=1 Tax=Alteromonas stellipolaris TaxID=233316 RepID=UPI0026E2C371|nr:hypothetical protein [Alteromonas stellipolaris]MDO6533774.1 hypothetical protein [Alteromonas stellipolaris]MDO6540767.1 hypothetical protein [Alteromonas stellipolaris]MDO6625232.1 hypothetical protein [Alteromonas stellipolaris]